MHAHFASRSRACHRQCLSTSRHATMEKSVRIFWPALSHVIPARARQPGLRSQPECVVRAGTSCGGFCRDIRRVAEARLALAPAVSAVEGIGEARICGSADDETHRTNSAGWIATPGDGAIERVEYHAARALREEACLLRH